MSYSDFTEDHYKKILLAAKSNWQFINYSQYKQADRAILWRHDVDVSLNRAFKLASIEYEVGVASTFFLMLHSPFYNLLEYESIQKVKKILAMNHKVGLHFDPSFYEESEVDSDLARNLKKEKSFLEELFGISIEVFSWHNPTVAKYIEMEDETYAGMVNVYSKDIKSKFKYLSDSNGYWRFENLYDVIFDGEEDFLHVLTHPEWWQNCTMSPRQRIFRSVYGRMYASITAYDNFLELHSRNNICGASESLFFFKSINLKRYRFLDMLWMSREFEVLFLELWRIYQSQLINLYKIFLCKTWLINKDDVEIFLEQVCLKYDCLLLFSEIFKKNLGDIVDFKDSDYTKWLQIKNKIVNSIEDQFLDLEAGCVFMSQLIHKISVWGSKTLSYDGIESPPEHYTEVNNLSFKPNIEAWFKLKTAFELKDLGKK